MLAVIYNKSFLKMPTLILKILSDPKMEVSEMKSVK